MIGNDKLRDLISYLQGSCMSFEEACMDMGLETSDIDEEELMELDSEIVNCSGCGWWVESHEIVDEGVCDSCWEDREEF